MCEKNTNYYETILPNGKRGLRADGYSYHFCDDLWGNIKGFLFPIDLDRSKVITQFVKTLTEPSRILDLAFENNNFPSELKRELRKEYKKNYKKANHRKYSGKFIEETALELTQANPSFTELIKHLKRFAKKRAVKCAIDCYDNEMLREHYKLQFLSPQRYSVWQNINLKEHSILYKIGYKYYDYYWDKWNTSPFRDELLFIDCYINWETDY
jgi:hypothetical protein